MPKTVRKTHSCALYEVNSESLVSSISVWDLGGWVLLGDDLNFKNGGGVRGADTTWHFRRAVHVVAWTHSVNLSEKFGSFTTFFPLFNSTEYILNVASLPKVSPLEAFLLHEKVCVGG